LISAGQTPLFVLASASPRRRDLLAQIALSPDLIEAADLDETPSAGELPEEHALRLAQAKARFVGQNHPAAFILAADTVVARGRRILPKALDRETALLCLHALSGRRHRVHGAVALLCPDGRLRSRSVVSVVTFKRLMPREIDEYLATGEWREKAGGYAIQGYAARFVRFLSGSYSNVVGLPLYETAQLLAGQGYATATRARSQP
jgi:septum formation protein